MNKNTAVIEVGNEFENSEVESNGVGEDATVFGIVSGANNY